MKNSVIADALARQLLAARAMVGALADALDAALDLANGLAEDARTREIAIEAAQQPAPAEDDGPRVFGRPRELVTADNDPVSSNAVGIVPADDIPIATGEHHGT